MDAVEVTAADAAGLDAIYEFCASMARDAAGWKCSAVASFHPERAQLDAYASQPGTLTFAFRERGAVVGFVIVRDSGYVKWFLADPSRFEDVAALMIDTVVARCGTCRGVVDNPDVRAAFARVEGVKIDGREVHL